MTPALKTLFKCLYAFCLLLPLKAAAQPGFDRIYNYCNTQIQSVYRSALADSQRIILAGTARRDSFAICNRDVSFIAAYNYSGTMLWKKQLLFTDPFFDGNEVNGSYNLVKLAPNRYAISLNGYRCDGPYTYARAAIYVFDQNGDSLGFYKLPSGSTEFNAPFALKTDAQNNFLLGGFYIGVPNAEMSPGMLTKFSQSGQFLWNKMLQTADSVTAPISQVLKILLGNRPNEYVLGGYKPYDSSSHNTTDAIWKTDTAGNILWQRNLPKYPGWNNNYEGDAQLSIINASNGSGYYFATTGTKPVQYPGEAPSYRVVYYCGKLNEEGHVVWAKTYELDTLGGSSSLAIEQKKNGDLLISGFSGHVIATEQRELTGNNLICTDSLGHVKWMKIYKRYDCPYLPQQILSALSLSPTESIVRAGGINQVDPQLPCWDTAGSISWLVYTDSLGRLNPNDTATWTLKEEAVNYNPVAIREPAAQLPGLSIYPNPGKGLFHIQLSVPANVTVTVWDAAGKPLLRKALKGTAMQADLSGYPAGLYLFRVEHEAGAAVLQMVVKE